MPGTPLKIAFVTLGCKLNYAETSTYERGFVAAGLEPVGWRDGADVFLVNTCTVTETANRKCRSEIRKLHRLNPSAPIFVTGCYAELRSEEVAAIEGVARVFRASEKAVVVPEVLARLKIPRVAHPSGGTAPAATQPSLSAIFDGIPSNNQGDTDIFDHFCESASSDIFGAYSSGERTRSFLKVQDGCDNFCRYCTVPYARGRSRNIPICEAVRMAREIAAAGIREIVLTGVNTGDFGRSTGESFLDLLKALNEVEGIDRYRISSIEPNLLTEEIVDWIASGTKFQPHFHIPLQVGCDELLAAMGRKYTTADFAAKIAYVRSAMEGSGRLPVFFGIDVMVGLPGETPELFERTYRFLEELRPAFIHVFPYSKRPGTPAAVMPGQVPPEVKAERVARLEELCTRLHSEFETRCKGLRATVLWESHEKDGTMGGYTDNYIRITRPYDPDRVNTLEKVII
ncbi:MAG: tRNA (N(6)-L-threonylcarbamoyladenosine(37)-C(2))-methylthiotransferase MtaB [Bacteroidales bacterium]|nr:tRNA (N(6)-L-threonylcarbamoyladenosine(37)-C(2))-methylthiotransferase MtaB [Bacteroidales bacterium]